MSSDSLNGDVMADLENGDNQSGPDHEGTYVRFMSITKWAVVGIAGALILMALLLA
jgi:hypothetical protein